MNDIKRENYIMLIEEMKTRIDDTKKKMEYLDGKWSDAKNEGRSPEAAKLGVKLMVLENTLQLIASVLLEGYVRV